MIKLSSEECSAIAFYGINSAQTSIASFYSAITQFYQEVGHPPDKIAVVGQGFSGKWITFKNGHTKLNERAFDGVSALSIVSLLPGAKIPMNDYSVTASFSKKWNYASFICRSSIVNLESKTMRDLAERIAKKIEPAYGIGYNREHRLGPALYAIGMCQGMGPNGLGIPSQLNDAERKESESISRWGDALQARIWERGLLRDVYPLNFLTPPHLIRLVNGLPLDKWIRSNQSRGTLELLAEKKALWKVEGPQIPILQQQLEEANVIFNWRKHQLVPNAF